MGLPVKPITRWLVAIRVGRVDRRGPPWVVVLASESNSCRAPLPRRAALGAALLLESGGHAGK
jgi:hypothetical protein